MSAVRSMQARVSRRLANLLMWGGIRLQDAGRSLHWYLGGGRARFISEWRDKAARNRWCFIVGCNNSGTSLLQRMLEETGQVSTFRYEGQRYTRALAHSERKGYERVWSEYIDDLAMTPDDGFAAAPRLVHDWLLSLSEHGKIIVEKTPANTVRMRWLQEVFPDSCFIGLVRNGYAVVEGTRRKSQKSIERAARHWNIVNRAMLEESGAVNRFMLLRYEDMTGDPATVSRAVANFIGVAGSAVSHALGREYALPTASGSMRQPVTDMNAGSLARLSDDEMDAIYAIAGEMLDYFGYGSPVEARAHYE